MNWKIPPEGIDLNFISDELMQNFQIIHDEYVQLCKKGYYMDTVQVGMFPGEVMKDEISRMVFGWLPQ
jgi:hypothetical protein